MKLYCSFTSCDRVFKTLNSESLLVLCVFLFRLDRLLQPTHQNKHFAALKRSQSEWDSRLWRQVDTKHHRNMSLKVSGAIYSWLLITQLVHLARVCRFCSTLTEFFVSSRTKNDFMSAEVTITAGSLASTVEKSSTNCAVIFRNVEKVLWKHEAWNFCCCTWESSQKSIIIEGNYSFSSAWKLVKISINNVVKAKKNF